MYTDVLRSLDANHKLYIGQWKYFQNVEDFESWFSQKGEDCEWLYEQYYTFYYKEIIEHYKRITTQKKTINTDNVDFNQSDSENR